MQVRVARSGAIFCMAAWLAGTIAMGFVATQNFFTINPLIAAHPNPAFAADIQKLGGPDPMHSLLYYFSSELNRLYFQYWNAAQLAIGIIAFWLVMKIPGARKPKWTIVSMLAIVLFLTVLITPRIISVGRSIDFVPRVPPPDGLRTFGLLHATYSVFDGMILVLGIMATWWLVRLDDRGRPAAGS